MKSFPIVNPYIVAEHLRVFFFSNDQYFSRMMGYPSGSPTSNSYFGSVPTNSTMDNVKCAGNETSIFECAHDTVDDCDSDEGAGVICTRPGIVLSFWCKHHTYVQCSYVVSFLTVPLDVQWQKERQVAADQMKFSMKKSSWLVEQVFFILVMKMGRNPPWTKI